MNPNATNGQPTGNCVILRREPIKHSLGMLFCLSGILVMVPAAQKHGHANHYQFFVDVLVIAALALGLIVFCAVFLPSRMKLCVSDTGFAFAIAFRSFHYRWQDAARFWKTALRARDAVGFDFSESYMLDFKRRKVSGDSARQLRLIPDTYGITAQELLDLLSRWHEKNTTIIPG